MKNEKRLIDANALGIGIAKPEVFDNPAYADGWNSAISTIENAPTVDAVEVVRCKDCKHFIQKEHGCNYFGYYSHTPWVDEVDFCSYGEGREGE